MVHLSTVPESFVESGDMKLIMPESISGTVLNRRASYHPRNICRLSIGPDDGEREGSLEVC